jgi:excisionase family DNA binding protein
MITAERVELLTITQAADVFGATRGALHHYRLSGRLPMIRVGRKFLVSREAVEQLRSERAAVLATSKVAVN